jgi:hypothetical protein
VKYEAEFGLVLIVQEPQDDDDDGMLETNWKFIPYRPEKTSTDAEMVDRSRDFYELMNRRRTLRMFSNRPVPKAVIENILLTAGCEKFQLLANLFVHFLYMLEI